MVAGAAVQEPVAVAVGGVPEVVRAGVETGEVEGAVAEGEGGGGL